ncbi:unnamed protein product [Orchesella dallaii]|uniref:C2H2-type domain-containing protein n=1 Tax=Orchesella dallaii TaxID=48710 RepID=A0ABP1RA87_9HEXA
MESLSSSEDFNENDEEEITVDQLNKTRKLEENQFQFYDESETVGDRNDDVDSDPEIPPKAKSSSYGSASSTKHLSESSWDEDRRPKRSPIRKRKRLATATPRAKAKRSKVDATNKKVSLEKVRDLELHGWNCSICKEPTVDEPNLKKHIECHQNKFIRKIFPCTFCSRSFETSLSVDNHVMNTHMTVACDGAYSCDASGCTVAFFTLEELNSHSETHLKPEKHLRMCETCGLGCLNLTRLKLHKLRHILPIKLLSADKNAPKRKGSRLLFPCSSCDEIFPKFLALHDHFCHLHCSGLSANHYKCPNCGKSARSKQLHRCGLNYGRGKTKSVKLVCTDCDDQKEYKNWYGLQAHRRDFHVPIKCSRCGETVIGLLAKKEHDAGGDRTCVVLHYCSTCGKGYTSARRLESHTRSVHIESRFKCTFCDKAFKVKLHLQDHMVALHSHERPQTCVHCGKNYATRNYLQNHLAKVHQVDTNAEKKHHCPSCKESFGRRELLYSHILKCDPVAAAVIMPTCDICGRPIMNGNQKTMMEKHVITHMSPQERAEYWKQQGKEEVVHLCPTCGKEYKTKQCMERHSSVHSVKKTFLCEQCPKAFPAKFNLELHIKHVHSKEIMMAPCKICGRPVVNGLRKDMMEKHVVTHMSAQERAEYYHVKGIKMKVYPCSVCKKEFKSKQYMEGHSCVYATKKFNCEQCPKTFLGEFSLHQHVRKIHSKSKKD